MLYWKIRWMEFKKIYWKNKSRSLFTKYGQLDLFEYHGFFYGVFGFIGDDFITVGVEDQKIYYTVDNRKSYKDLKHMLKLELKIRYNEYL